MIEYQLENVSMPDLDEYRVEEWLEAVADSYGKELEDMTYRFCDDEAMLAYNREYLGHDYYTDIITFDNSIGDIVSGDILISLDTVRSNAEEVGATYQRELLRVIVHGLLHLCGIDDKGPGEREIMEAAENRALDLYDSLEG